MSAELRLWSNSKDGDFPCSRVHVASPIRICIDPERWGFQPSLGSWLILLASSESGTVLVLSGCKTCPKVLCLRLSPTCFSSACGTFRRNLHPSRAPSEGQTIPHFRIFLVTPHHEIHRPPSHTFRPVPLVPLPTFPHSHWNYHPDSRVKLVAECYIFFSLRVLAQN